MRKAKSFGCFAVLPLFVVFLGLATPATAEEEDEGSFTGRFRLGLRAVSVNGTETKYKQHFNLDDGPRLFELNFRLEPAGELRSYADEVEVDVNNLGGDPFEFFRFAVRKFGKYNFSFNRTESIYFYEDIILPVELSEPSLSNAGDFHTFDFERVRDRADLDIHINSAARLNLSFDRFTKKGESTTTLDIQRDEFELDKPVHETMDALGAAFQYSWDKVTLVLEERYRDYENLIDIFLPGQSLGENPENATILDFFFLDQPYDFESFEHTVRVNARPNDRLILRASGVLQDLDLEAAASETSQGIDFRGLPFETDIMGNGNIDRDYELFDFEASYLINRRVAIIGGVAQRNLDQKGGFVFGDEENLGDWDIETTTVEGGIEVSVTPQLTVTGGVRREERDVKAAHTAEGELEMEDEKTDHTGYYAVVAWEPSRIFRINAELEDSSYDDPFTLASPTDRQRYRLQAQANLPNGVFVSGSFLVHEYENDNSGWEAERDHYSVRAGYRRSGLDFSFGYAVVETERSIDQLVTTLPGFLGGIQFLFPVFYESDADFFDGRVYWEATDRVRVGGDFRLYDNDGDFALKRDDARAWVEFDLVGNYLLHLGYRYINYEEEVFGFNDYDADIGEVSFGYRW